MNADINKSDRMLKESSETNITLYGHLMYHEGNTAVWWAQGGLSYARYWMN